jgi:hypothetical protein
MVVAGRIIRCSSARFLCRDAFRTGYLFSLTVLLAEVAMRRAGARSCRMESIVLKLIMRISKSRPRRDEKENAFLKTL